ncbi:acyltransferase [Ideonella sp.]|uniref:acyltransferase family protein n=1 Tax=Ideonella sp. TaxID=1929293 RepID=UPI002B4896AB|nr:acyltransferase [Ideonella sp.]HJV68724.1 acyltransferase [Ideonella sp.]
MHRNLSIYLDLIRFLAAAMVFVVHANYERFTGGLPVLWRFKDLGNDAVMVFFVLSGFVIAHVAAHKERTIEEYAASRFARLYSVALPALILTMALDAAGSRLDPSLYTGRWYEYDAPLVRILGALTFSNELWFSYIRPFSNGPYWSLGYEVWYYVLFGAAHFLRGKTRVAAVTVISLLIGPKILLLLPVWLLGVWAYRRCMTSTISVGAGLALFFGSIALYLAFRLAEGPHYLLELSEQWLGKDFLYDDLSWSRRFLASFLIGTCVAANFIGAAALAPHLRRAPALLERPIRYVAGFTFALYLLHYPLVQFFAALTPAAGLEEHRAAFVALGSLAVVWLLGGSIERQKEPLKAMFLTWLDHRPRPSPAIRSLRTR